MTLGGQTFFDMQVASHQAEVSKLAKQPGIYYEEHEVMNNSARTSNVVEVVGSSESPSISNTYHRSTCHT